MSANEETVKDMEDLTVEKDAGVLKQITKPAAPGSEKAGHKDTCHVRYVGTYLGGQEDGKEFDRSDKFNFQLGIGNVIKAWDLCLATMKIGEVCQLIVAPKYGYNDGKTMKFEIELLSVDGQDISEAKDGSITKSVLEEGEGLVNPPFGVETKISYQILSPVGAAAAPVVELTYLTGDPEEKNIPKAIDLAVRNMTQGEKAKVQVIDTKYQVTLHSFEKLKHLSTFETFADQMKYTETLKEKANNHLKSGKYLLAVETYKRLANDLEYLVTNGVDEQKTLTAIKVVVHINTALAYMKMKDTDMAMDQCEKALKLDPANEKAHFRLGQVYLILNDQEEALKHFKACLHYHPNNIDASKMKQHCEEQMAKAKEVEKARFRGIFNRLKETGLGLPEEPEEPPQIAKKHDHAGCGGCCSDEEEEEEPVQQTA